MASCLPVPTVAPPSLPSPFTIPPLTITSIGTSELTLCCKLPPIATPPIPIPLPGLSVLLLIPGAVDALSAGVEAIATYINQLPLKCPVE